MARPSKPVNVLKFEQKSHRTKAELECREIAEKALLTGTRLKEQPAVKENPAAHREFLRVRHLLRAIDKDDALYQGVINRYCQLYAECLDFEEKRETFYEVIERLNTRFYDSGECGMEESEFYSTLAKLERSVIDCDKQVQAKRRMLLDIEKENVMTIASALRAIPKTPQEDEGGDQMLELMKRQMEARQRFGSG